MEGYTQGKCPKCKIAFRFACPARLKDAFCPECGTKLVATTWLYKGTWKTVTYAFSGCFNLKRRERTVVNP